MTMGKRLAVLIFSGGMDSTVLLWDYLSRDYRVLCLTFDYGQRHWREIGAADRLVHLARQQFGKSNVEWIRIKAGWSHLLKNNSQTGVEEVPEGHYTDENMKKTVVPNRNMVFLAMATSVAIEQKADVLAFGAHGGDHAIYPDCRVAFVLAMAHAIGLADWHKVILEAPFVAWNKSEIARLGDKLKVPFAQTWSCYKGGEKHCGKCGTCVERAEAFALSGVTDPTEYAIPAVNVPVLPKAGP
jgi:7-cyano-7-deazaguanine synthase